nr:hypothetical protein [Bacteroidota bacterium]
ILMNRKYAQQEFYKGAMLCKSGSIKDIETALNKSLEIKLDPIENIAILECRASSVGKKYRDCYSELMK